MIVDFQIYKDLEIEANFESTLTQVDEQVLNTLVLASEELAQYIVAEKLSGQVLNRRSGKLQESISASEVLKESFQYTMRVSQDEDIAPYGPAHEYGAEIPERFGNPVMHWTTPEGIDVFARRARAYTLPARSFMRSALEENDAHIQELVAEALNRAILTQWGT
jgi:hypothetical protein